MTEMRGSDESRHADGPTLRLSGGMLGESHLLPDAVVAFVDGELTAGAHERAAMHLVGCGSCAAEVDAQRQARRAVHDSAAPAVPAALLASLQSIPDSTSVSATPDNLAVTDDGQLVAMPSMPASSSTTRSAPLGSTTPLGASAPLGSPRRTHRRTVQGAGVVMSGLVVGALALTLSFEGPSDAPSTDAKVDPDSRVVPAKFPTVSPASASTTPTTATTATPSTAAGGAVGGR